MSFAGSLLSKTLDARPSVDFAFCNLAPSFCRYFSVSRNSCLTRSDFASYNGAVVIRSKIKQIETKMKGNLKLQVGQKIAGKPHLNHPKISLNIIVLKQIDFLSLDPIQFLPMNPFFPLVKLFHISIETLQAFSLNLEAVLKFLSAKISVRDDFKWYNTIMTPVKIGIQPVSLYISKELLLSLTNSLLPFFLHFLFNFFKLFHTPSMSMFLHCFYALQVSCAGLEKVHQKFTA